MTILRSTSKDKSNRVVEVILASVRSSDLMLGKIIGIGLSALVQLVMWSVFVVIGLVIFKEFIFTDIFDPSNYEGIQYAADIKNDILLNASSSRYNAFIDLIFHRINYGVIFPVFFIFFLVSYFFMPLSLWLLVLLRVPKAMVSSLLFQYFASFFYPSMLASLLCITLIHF